MKSRSRTILIFVGLNILSLLILSACGMPWAPKDQKINDSRITYYNNGQYKNDGSLRVGKMAMSILATEMSLRDLVIIRSALDSSIAEKRDMTSKVIIGENSSQTEYEIQLTPQKDFGANKKSSFSINSKWKVSVLKTNDIIVKISAHCEGCSYSWTAPDFKAPQNPREFKFISKNEEFTVDLIVNDSTPQNPNETNDNSKAIQKLKWKISGKSEGSLKGQAFGKSDTFSLKHNYSMVVDDLLNSEQNLTQEIHQIEFKKGLFANLQSSSNIVKHKDRCSYREGDFSHSGGRQSALLHFHENDISQESTTWKSNFFVCDERPLMDFGRLLQDDQVRN